MIKHLLIAGMGLFGQVPMISERETMDSILKNEKMGSLDAYK